MRIGIKLLGFKDISELAFEDNVKHSLFLYPDETVRLLFTILIFVLRYPPELFWQQTHLCFTPEIDGEEKKVCPCAGTYTAEFESHILCSITTSKDLSFWSISSFDL